MLNDYQEYRQCLEQATQYEKSPLETFKEKKVQYLEECLNTQFNLGCVFAYVELRELEAENVLMLVQGAAMGQQEEVRAQMRR